VKRRKCIVFLCHCILNCNSKVEGLSNYKGAQETFVNYLVANGYGLIQLPCPEITMYGIKRWGHVKEQFDSPYFRKHCQTIFLPIMEQIIDYVNSGYTCKALIGIDGSPSCGVNHIPSSALWGGEVASKYGLESKIKDLKTINAQGVFIEEIAKLLKKNQIWMDFIAIDEGNPEASIDKIIKILEGRE